MATAAQRYSVRMAWRNTYGTERIVATFVQASSERTAIAAARTQAEELYGITRARLISCTIDR